MNEPNVRPETVERLVGFKHPEELGSSFVDRLSKTFDNAGKIVAAIAGAGLFFYLAGLFVMWQRLKKEGLPSEESLAVLPRDQVAIAGVREVLLSVISASVLLFLLGFLLVRGARLVAKLRGEHPSSSSASSSERKQREGARWQKPFGWLLERIALGSLLVMLTLLVFPLSRVGIFAALVLSALFYYSVRLTQRCLRTDNTDFPLWRVGLAVLAAVLVLSVAREREFPSQFAPVTAVMKQGKPFNGVYVGASSDSVLVGQRRIDLAGQSLKGSRLLVLSRDTVKRLRLRRVNDTLPRAKSLLGLLGIGVTCIPPECRVGNSRVGS